MSLNEDPKPDVIVCAPHQEGMAMVPGSTLLWCHKCGREVSIAPSGQEVFLANPGIAVICVLCAVNHLNPEGEMKASPHVQDELRMVGIKNPPPTETLIDMARQAMRRKRRR